MALTQAELDAAQTQINAAREQTYTNIGLAKGWADIAEAAAEASGSGSAQVATAEANRAAQQKALAETARTGAETARTGAETARTGAETAQGLAEDARDRAETARDANESFISGSLMSQAEATAGTATTARTTSAAGLKGAIQRWATGTYSTAISAIGQALNRAATAADARSAIGAGTSNLAIGTTASTAKAGNWTPGISQVTGLQAELDGKEKKSWQGTQAQYDALGSYDADRTYYVVDA